MTTDDTSSGRSRDREFPSGPELGLLRRGEETLDVADLLMDLLNGPDVSRVTAYTTIQGGDNPTGLKESVLQVPLAVAASVEEINIAGVRAKAPDPGLRFFGVRISTGQGARYVIDMTAEQRYAQFSWPDPLGRGQCFVFFKVDKAGETPA